MPEQTNYVNPRNMKPLPYIASFLVSLALIILPWTQGYSCQIIEQQSLEQATPSCHDTPFQEPSSGPQDQTPDTRDACCAQLCCVISLNLNIIPPLSTPATQNLWLLQSFYHHQIALGHNSLPWRPPIV